MVVNIPTTIIVASMSIVIYVLIIKKWDMEMQLKVLEAEHKRMETSQHLMEAKLGDMDRKYKELYQEMDKKQKYFEDQLNERKTDQKGRVAVCVFPAPPFYFGQKIWPPVGLCKKNDFPF